MYLCFPPLSHVLSPLFLSSFAFLHTKVKSSFWSPPPQPKTDATIMNFCEMLEDFCGRAEIPTDDQNDTELLSLPVADVRIVVNEIMSLRAKKLLHLVSVDILVRLLRVLDHQIHRAEGLSVDEREHVSNMIIFLFIALVTCRYSCFYKLVWHCLVCFF